MKIVATNRHGSQFGRSRSKRTYAGSGLRFASYYTLVCVRCGWAFKPPRHKTHRLANCDAIRREVKREPMVAAHVKRNLRG